MSASPDRYEYRRRQMIAALRSFGVQDEQVLAAMAAVPRHHFVPDAYQSQAYSDSVSIHIGAGQTISQPRVVALMTEAARIGSDDRVLEVGTGSGYQAAVLSHLARFVLSVERVPSLARGAKQKLDRLGIENVSVKVMDGTLGWRAQAPYRAILVTAGAPHLPEHLIDQLAAGGRMVVPIGSREQQVITVLERRGDRHVITELQNACFVPLVGRYGWDDQNEKG